MLTDKQTPKRGAMEVLLSSNLDEMRFVRALVKKDGQMPEKAILNLFVMMVTVAGAVCRSQCSCVEIAFILSTMAMMSAYRWFRAPLKRCGHILCWCWSKLFTFLWDDRSLPTHTRLGKELFAIFFAVSATILLSYHLNWFKDEKSQTVEKSLPHPMGSTCRWRPRRKVTRVHYQLRNISDWLWFNRA